LSNVITLSLLHPLNKHPVQHWNFEEESVIRIGRSTDNNVVLYSAVVSRHHVELRHQKRGWEVVNLGTNGTYLDGKRVTQVPVEDGMVIRLARSGPNIQINVTSDGREAVQALLRLKKESAAQHPAKASTSAFSKTTDVQPHEETLVSPGELSDEDEPTSGSAR
jgi:pSer/pThr/pTyr-binding forkhead associated (FHA) protein